MNPWMTPGVSFHRELELFAMAGIPPIDIVTIATRNGAESLGILGSTGTLEVGKTADLLLVRSDPLEDIANLRDIELVMRAGTVHAPAALRAR